MASRFPCALTGAAISLLFACGAQPSAKDAGEASDGGSADAGAAVQADRFIWGTEGGLHVLSADSPPSAVTSAAQVIKNTLQLEYVKLRLSSQSHAPSPEVCIPGGTGCDRLNLDETVKLFKANGWSMVPMISLSPSVTTVTSDEIDRYAAFVKWFVDRYKGDAHIRYLELENAPMFSWHGTKEQLLELQNKTYDQVKSAHPEVLIGTPGFEYFMDSTAHAQGEGLAQVEYFLSNGARFDFWAFHGYPATGGPGQAATYPPTKTSTTNLYANVAGILEIRKRLDANGWQARPIIDTEHTGMVPASVPQTSENDALDAAYSVQELTLKRALRNAQGLVLAGALPLKIRPRGAAGEDAWGSLKADGSLTQTVAAVALLVDKLGEARHLQRLSGQFDREAEAWVEKFETGEGEVYVAFRPFAFRQGQKIALDPQSIAYSLDLGRVPRALRLINLAGDVKSLAPEQVVALQLVNAPQFVEVEY